MRMLKISTYMHALILLWLCLLSASVIAQSLPLPIAEWRLESSSWNGSVDEVIDASGNGHHGQLLANTLSSSASPAITGDPGTCDYATQSLGAIDIAGLPVNTSRGAKTTVSFWMNWNGDNNMMPIGWGSHDIWMRDGSIGFNTFASDIYGISSAGLSGGWHHMVVEFTNGNVLANKMYVDGSLQTLSQRLGRPNNRNAVVGSQFRIGGVTRTNGFRFSGSIDEVRIYNTVLTPAQVTTLYNDTHSCSGANVNLPIAEWRMDALSWSGVANEVLDSSGNNYNGVAEGMTTTSGLVCNAGDFSADGVRDYLNLNNSALNGRGDFSISVWAQTTNNGSQAIVSGSSGSQHNELIMWFPNASNFQPYLKGSGSGGNINTSGINDGSWHHLLWTRAGAQNCLYVDGALRSCRNRPSNPINIASGGLIVGQEQDQLGGGFQSSQDWQGSLDELLVFDNALSSAEAALIYNNQLAGNNWDGSPRVCPVPLTPLVEYRMDETSWSGVAGEVIDSSANGFNATAVNGAQTSIAAPAIPSNPGTCHYGEFDGNDYIDSAVNIGETDAAIALWFKTNNANGGLFVAKAGGVSHGSHDRNIYLSGGNVRARLWREQTIASSGTNYADGAWHHLAYTYGTAVGGQRLYIDGALVASGSKSASNFTWQSNVMIGYSQNGRGGYFVGSIDEVKIYDSTLTAAQIQNIMNDTRPCLLAPIADWHMDEPSWDSTANEVIDSSGNGYNGTAFGSSTTTGLVCNAGDFSANGINDYLSLNNAALNGLTDFSISVWAKTQSSSAQGIVSGSSGSQHNELIMWFSNASTFQPHLKGGSSGGNVSVSFNDDSWHHLFWTRTGSQNCLYVDGVLRGCVTRSTQALSIASGGFIIAQEQDSLAGRFDRNQDWEGLLDELMVFDTGLSATEATQIYTNQLAGNNWDGSPRTCPAANVDHYQISHSGSSPACLAAPITIRAHDNSDILMTPSASTTINVSTSDGLGNWSAASSASGVFTAGTAGRASYTFANGENAVDLFLAHSTIANGIDIDVSDGSATDQDGIAEDDPIDFVEAGFIFLANGVVDNIGTQISGKDSTVVSSLAANQTVTLQAVRTDTNTGACVAAIQSPQAVNLAYECRNPTTCDLAASLTLAGANIASNNNGSSSNATAVLLNFDTNGVAQLGGVNYNDAGLIRLHAQSSLVATGAHPASTLTGSSNEFVVKPAGLCVQAIATTLADPTCGAPYYDCSKFVAAATDFELEVSGRAWGGLVESNATLCNNAVTPNFVVGPINLTHNLIAPSVSSGGAIGSIAVASTSINDKGKRTINQQFSEVGVIDVTATLPAPSPYINNETIAASSSAPIGRFIPDKFTLSAGSITEACSSATAFTYMGQNFVASYTLNAVNALGALTTNYAGSFAKGMQTGWPQFGGVDGSFAVTSLGRLDSSTGTSISWAAAGATAAGQGLVDSHLQLSRVAADGPYLLNVGVQIEDTDEVRIGNNLTLTVGTDSFAPIGQSNQRYGRVRVENAFGSELVDLSVPVKAEYFDAIQNRFLLNADDGCTALIDTDVAITDASAEPIVPSDTSVIILESLTAGISEIIFAAPGASNDGSLNINLSVDNWLKFNWLGAGDVNPSSQITFGSYRGNDRVIYRHEILQ